MPIDRAWYWVARLIDPREVDKVRAGMFSSLAFMSETLVLEPHDHCFFRTSGRVPSQCVVVGGSRGADTLDQTTVALQRVKDAAVALSLVTYSKYDTEILHFGLDQLPEEFLPGPETYLRAGFGRCPPLSSEDAVQIKKWYAALRGARTRRNADSSPENVVAMSIDALMTNNKFKGVLLYAAFEEMCDVLGGFAVGKTILRASKEERNRIERARRPVAHGGVKGKLSQSRAVWELQAEATSSFGGIFFRFLDALRTRPSSS